MIQRHNWQNQQNQELPNQKIQYNHYSDPSRELDMEYLSIREQIIMSNYYLKGSKHIKIRLNSWIQKLDQIISNPIWKRNRNNYAKLINLMCQCQTIVDPFSSLPPQDDVPKLSKHQINSIIDEVERAVKTQKVNTKGSPIYSRPKKTYIKPQQYWSRLKSDKETVKSSQVQEQSLFLGRFNSIAQKQKDQLNFGCQNQQFHSINQEGKSSKFQSQNNIYFSDIKNKQNMKISSRFSQSKNIKTNQPFLKGHQKGPRHLTATFNMKINQIELSKTAHAIQKSLKYSSTYSSNMNISEDKIENQSRLEAYRDTHTSIEMENQTLKTEYFETDISIHPQIMHELSYISVEQCDFTDQLSERCRENDKILNHSYFSWKEQQQIQNQYKDKLFQRQKNKINKLIPTEPIIKDPKQNPSPHLLSKDIQSEGQRQLLKIQNEIFNKAQDISLTSEYSVNDQFLREITDCINSKPVYQT